MTKKEKRYVYAIEFEGNFIGAPRDTEAEAWEFLPFTITGEFEIDIANLPEWAQPHAIEAAKKEGYKVVKLEVVE